MNARNDWREIHVKPDGWDYVDVTLVGRRACGTAGAICTGDGKTLSNTLTATVEGPVAITVVDAKVEEGPGVTLNFVVSLNFVRIRCDDTATAIGTPPQPDQSPENSGPFSSAPVGALDRFPDYRVDRGIVACGGPRRDGIAAKGIEGALRHDLSRLVNAGSQVVEVARIVEIVEVDERRCRRIAAGEAHRAAAAPPQGADTHAESALAAARPPPFEQQGEEVVLDVGMRGLWARAREGTDLDTLPADSS